MTDMVEVVDVGPDVGTPIVVGTANGFVPVPPSTSAPMPPMMSTVSRIETRRPPPLYLTFYPYIVWLSRRAMVKPILSIQAISDTFLGQLQMSIHPLGSFAHMEVDAT
jgi:hypothetical protein